MSDRVRVLVVEAGRRVAGRLVDAVGTRGSVSVVGSVTDAASAIEALSQRSTDLVVVDLDHPDADGEAAISSIAAAGGRGRVLATSERLGVAVAADALAAGASGVLPIELDRSTADLFRRALAGELVLPADELSRLVGRITAPEGRDRADEDALGALTAREHEILRTLAAGASTVEVAEAFGISPLTVQSHVKSILAKLGVHSRVEAMRVAWRHGLTASSRSPSPTG